MFFGNARVLLRSQLEHEIIIFPDVRPNRLKAYKIPKKLKQAVDQHIQELLKLGFIHESKSTKFLRWALALQNFDICFRYEAGKSNAMAAPDCLSRMGPDDDGVKPSVE